MEEVNDNPIPVFNLDAKDKVPMMHNLICITDNIPGKEDGTGKIPGVYFCSICHFEDAVVEGSHLKWKQSTYVVKQILGVRGYRGIFDKTLIPEGSRPKHYSLIIEMFNEYIKPKEEPKEEKKVEPKPEAPQA